MVTMITGSTFEDLEGLAERIRVGRQPKKLMVNFMGLGALALCGYNEED